MCTFASQHIVQHGFLYFFSREKTDCGDLSLNFKLELMTQKKTAFVDGINLTITKFSDQKTE